MIKKCSGCGVVLQDENMLQEGYTTSLENDVCQRCFRMRNYGEYQVVAKTNEEYIEILKEVGKTKDLVLYVTDLLNLEEDILKIREYIPNKMILVLNKIDQLNEEELFDLMKMYNAEGVFEQIVPISALKGRNINELLKVIKSHLEEGPQYFPDYMITDQPERVLVSELIREKVLHYIHDEVPHGVAVEIERMKSRKDKEIVDISAVIYCERDSHKGIIIGKNGRKLKGIGKSARADIELLLGSQANLQLWVKVKENWRNLQNYVSNFGYTEK